MVEISIIRDEKERLIEGLKKKNASENQIALIDEIVLKDDLRKEVQTNLDNILHKTNQLSDQIGELFKTGKAQEANALKAEVAVFKEESKKLDTTLKEIKESLDEMIVLLPNIPHDSVPFGKTPEDNEVFKSWAKEMPDLGSNALPHWELAEKYNLISFKDGVALTGSGFPGSFSLHL